MKTIIANKEVNQELLFRYIKIIQAMCVLRGKQGVYPELDRQRRDVHDLIIKEAGTTREDEQFNFELAEYVENLVF